MRVYLPWISCISPLAGGGWKTQENRSEICLGTCKELRFKPHLLHLLATGSRASHFTLEPHFPHLQNGSNNKSLTPGVVGRLQRGIAQEGSDAQ